VRCCEEPSPSPTSRRRCPCLSNMRRLGVWCRRVAGHPTSSGRRNVRTTTRPSNQRWHRLLLLVVVSDPDKSTTFRHLAALCRQRLRRGRIHCQWSFPRYPVLGGRGGTVLLLLAASVLMTPSSVVLWQVHPPQDSPYQVPVTRTLRTDQCIQSAVEPTTSQQLGDQALQK